MNQLINFLNISPAEACKTLIYKVDEKKVVAVMIRGR